MSEILSKLITEIFNIMEFPKAGLLLGYGHFFTDKQPNNRLELVRNIPKTLLIYELAACNYRLKPPTKIFFQYPIDQTIAEIRYFLALNPSFRDDIILKFSNNLKTISENSVIFNRAALLFAENEIINSNELGENENYQISFADQENIFKYLLLINDTITKYDIKIKGTKSFSQFERLNLAMLPLNEYSIPLDPFYTLYRGGSFYTFLSKSEYAERVEQFISSNTGLSPQNFIFEIAAMLFSNNIEKKNLAHLYKLIETDTRIKFFDFLSTRNGQSGFPLEFKDLKKSPFYKFSNFNYVLLDNMFLLSLCYDFFIWNFLFDFLLVGVTDSNIRRNTIKRFKGNLGEFYENYLGQMLKASLKPNNFNVKTTSELKIKVKEQEIELADVYIRKSNNIIIGEAKTTSLINIEKYAESVEDFYNGDINEFFKKHGLNQLVNSIKSILVYGRLIDKSFPNKRIKIYPVLFYNDLLLTNAFFPHIFNEKIQILIKESISESDRLCVIIQPLTMMHISDIEVLQEPLRLAHINIFHLLRKHHKKYVINMPFYLTANNLQKRIYPEKVITYFKNLIYTYNPNERTEG